MGDTSENPKNVTSSNLGTYRSFNLGYWKNDDDKEMRNFCK